MQIGRRCTRHCSSLLYILVSFSFKFVPSGMSSFSPRVEQKSPVTFTGGRQEFLCEIGLFRRLPGTVLFSQRIGPGTAVELGEEVQLRSIVRSNDGIYGHFYSLYYMSFLLSFFLWLFRLVLFENDRRGCAPLKASDSSKWQWRIGGSCAAWWLPKSSLQGTL